MYLFLIILLIPFLYVKYTLEIIDKLSYLIALVLYYLDIRKDIIEYNLNEVFPNITKNKMNKIRFKSIKYFLINLFICINQYLFYDSFLLKYYDKKKYILQKKSILVLPHFGIFYDFTSLYNQTKLSLYGIYKGKFNLPHNSNKIKCVKHNKIDFTDMNNYNIIETPIDQKSSNGIKVEFLGKEVKFHTTLIKYSILFKRNIFIYYVHFNDKKYKLIQRFIKINTNNKKLEEIVQEIASKMTNIIKNNPEQYLWLHNRFNLKIK
jgi:lauroyl/myristoyl acyltransferase